MGSMDWSFDDDNLEALFHGYEYMASFLAYFDESGTHDGAPYTVVAGAIAKLSSWRSISNQWQAMLDKFEIEEFHSNKMSNKRGEFTGWSENKRRAFTGCLFKILEKEKSLLPVGVAVPNKAFSQVLSGYPKLRLTAYQFCCESIVRMMSIAPEIKKRMKPITMTFEAGQRNYSPFMKPPRPNIDLGFWYETMGIKEINFVVRKGVIPLQVADLFAYESYKPFAYPESKPRYTFMRLWKGFNWIGALYTGEDDIKIQVECLNTIYSLYPDLPKVKS